MERLNEHTLITPVWIPKTEATPSEPTGDEVIIDSEADFEAESDDDSPDPDTYSDPDTDTQDYV